MTFNIKERRDQKRVVGLFFILAIIMFSPVQVLAAEGSNEWTLGYDEDKNGPVENQQGGNGWYFMYSNELNTDGTLDTSKVKECVWADRGSCWMWYGYSEMWMPDLYAEDDYDFQEQGIWWRMDGKGIMDPNTGTDTMRSVIAWEAPKSGTYSINLDYTAGTGSYEWEGITYYYDDGDGLMLSINTEKGVLEKVFCETVTEEMPDLPTGTLSTEAKLKKGEKIYVSADPREDGSGDVAEIRMDIKQIEVSGFTADRSVVIVVIAVVIMGAAILTVIFSNRKKKLRN